MEAKTLKSYKGMEIEKSYDLKSDGTIKKESIIYTAYDAEDSVFDGAKTLAELKKKIDEYK